MGGVANQGNTGIVYVRGTNSSGIYMNNIGSYFVEQDDTRIWIQRTRGGVTAKPFGDTVLESRSIDPTIESTTYNNYTRINEFGRYAIGRLGPEGETDTNFGIPGWVSVFGGNTNGIFNTPTFVIMPTTTLSTVKTNGALNNDGIRIQADQQGVRFPIPQVQQTNVQLSAASTFTWQFQYPYSDTNYSVSAQGAAAALVSPSVGAKTTTSVVISFTAFTGQLDLIAAHQ